MEKIFEIKTQLIREIYIEPIKENEEYVFFKDIKTKYVGENKVGEEGIESGITLRSLIKDVKFIKGMKYEDIPWWSELLMKPIKTTITQLPLYYYYVNRKSISKSINELERLETLLNGLFLIQNMYQDNGDMERLQMWSHNIKWAILVRGTKALARIMVSPDADKLVHYISDMVKTGLFDNATTPVELKAKEAYYTVAAGQKFSL